MLSHPSPRGVALVARRDPPGSIVLPPIAEHRVALHVSEHTNTRCRESGSRHARKRGDVDLIPSGSPGGYDAAAPSESLEIRLARGFVERVAEEIGIPRTRSIGTHHLYAEPGVRRLAAAFLDERPPMQLYVDSLGVALTIQLLRGSTISTAVSVTERQVQRVVDYIEANLSRDLTLAELAEVAAASSAYLRRHFRARMGEPLHRYVVRRRVTRAKELLAAGELAASEIALAVGFAHQSHMARWMRRLTGTTPRDVQRQGSREII
jgi:AraC family transcriptional regulator